MKCRKLIAASACCLCMALTQFARADAIGIKTIEKTNACAGQAAANLRVCNVYVTFDGPFPPNKLLSVGFSNVTTNDPLGYFQDAFGADIAPNSVLCPFFPTLCCDSFVTLGCKDLACAPPPGNNTSPDADFNTCGFNCQPQPPCDPGANADPAVCGQIVGGWFNGDPDNGNGNPDANLQVLIAQLTVHAGSSISGYATAFFNTGMCTDIVGNGMDDNPNDDCLGDALFQCFVECACDANNPNDPACDTPDPCTDSQCQPDCQCSPVFPEPPSTPCDADGSACTTDHCDGQGMCVNLSTVMCPGPSGPCDGGQSCDPATGLCVNNPDPVGNACGDPTDTECDNADTCDGMGNCADNLKTMGTPCGSSADTDCDNPDSCDGAGNCQNNGLPDGAGCTTDNNACTNDVCNNRVCTHPATPVGSPCGSGSNTECDNPDSCNGMGGCNANNELPGFPCGSGADTACDNPDSCNGTGSCVNNGEANGTPCPTEDDGNDCTNEVCNNRQCTHPNAANGTACSSPPCPPATPCTCQNGTCVSCTVDSDCDDNIDCTVDTCTATGCVNTPNDGACDDDNVCTNEFCNPATGCVYSDNDGAACDDGNPCTTVDTCSGGVCSGTPECTSDADCDVAAGEVCSPEGCCVSPVVDYPLDILAKKCPNKFNYPTCLPGGGDDDDDGGDGGAGGGDDDDGGSIEVYVVGTADASAADIDKSTVQMKECGGADSILPAAMPRLKDKVGPHETDCGDCSCAKLGKDGKKDLEVKFNSCDIAALIGDVPDGTVVELLVYGNLNDGTPFEAHDCIVVKRPLDDDDDDD